MFRHTYTDLKYATLHSLDFVYADVMIHSLFDTIRLDSIVWC